MKNVERKSVEGLSMKLFIIGLMANMCYGFSIGLRVPAINRDFWLSNNTKMVTSVCIAICMVGVGVSAAPVTEPPLCNSPPNVSEFLKTLGIVFSWVSNVSYVVARIPQVSIISIAPVLRATAGSVKGNYKIRRLKQTNDGRRS